MREQQRKPLTHKKCVQCNKMILKTILSIGSIIPTIATIVFGIMGKDVLILAVFSLVFLLCGVLFFIVSLKTNKKLQSGEYYIYLDTVSGKRKEENKNQNQDPNQAQNTNNTKYYLQFENNKYELPVSKKLYDTIKMNTQYYLLQLNGAKKAMHAFAESEYYLDDELQRRFQIN